VGGPTLPIDPAAHTKDYRYRRNFGAGAGHDNQMVCAGRWRRDGEGQTGTAQFDFLYAGVALAAERTGTSLNPRA
jgi:hypothetical protein